jgi:poly-gamma-glutamate capsule biosynthesis protein CapA/YwtB (metallophosphatase superfamily)
MRLFLCGDVMTGRGIDQLLPHPVDPRLYETAVRDARDYVELAERESGLLPRAVACDYVWGAALDVLAARQPQLRIINLETAVTAGGAPWPGKGVHYRMHPANGAVLTAAGIDACMLANNHVLDWGRAGLTDTLATLASLGIRVAGAGQDAVAASAPAVFERGPVRWLVFGFGFASSGIPGAWGAGPGQPGVNLLPEHPEVALERALGDIARHRRAGDRVIVSVHWGPNWGYRIAPAQRAFARGLVDAGAADLVHGHSSHHPLGMERYAGRLILYGCGDFLNDYEGIGSHGPWRSDLALMYFPELDDATGSLASLELIPLQIRQMRLHPAASADAEWLAGELDRESRDHGIRIRPGGAGGLAALW